MAENLENKNENSLSLVIKQNQKEEDDRPTNYSGTLSFTEKSDNQAVTTSEITHDEVAFLLIQYTDDEIFERIKKNEYLKLPYVDSSVSNQEWLTKALKTILSHEDIKKLGEKLRKQSGQTQNFSSQTTQNDKEILISQLQNSLDEATSQKNAAERRLKNVISVETYVDKFFTENPETADSKRLVLLLKDAIDSDNREVPHFLMQLGKGWFYVKGVLSLSFENEIEKMEKVHSALSFLLKCISEISITERRDALNCIARIVSESFKGYSFVSPEQNLQLDPMIHDAAGKGSGMVKEGITFAVIRKESKQPVKYAEIVIA